MTHDELVHAMVSAFREGIIGSDAEQREDFRFMSAALCVAVEEIRMDIINRIAANGGLAIDTTIKIADEVRSRYLKPKSVEERVKNKYLGDECCVLLDGKVIQTFDSEIHANRYTAGLISELKEQSND